jgi:DNA-binding CsgD family transcriptional regulator
MLEQFGISRAAEEVYLAKLSQPSVRATDLAAHVGLSLSEVDGVLAELVEHNLLRPPWQSDEDSADSGELQPVAPAVALDAVLARRQSEVLRQQHEIERARAALAIIVAELDSRIGGGTPTTSGPVDAQEIVSHDAARRALERLAFESHREVLTFAPTIAAPATASLTVTDPLTGYLLTKGVRVRMISVDSMRNNAAAIPHVRQVVKLGAEVRTAPTLPTSMVIVDRSRVMLPLDPECGAAGASIYDSAAVCAVMCTLFLQHWQDAKRWGEHREPAHESAGDMPTEQERALLELLLHGNTDDQAGRRLGVSTRTVGRMAADLMRRLGARSRFEAGALAVLRGWLTSCQPDAGPAPP